MTDITWGPEIAVNGVRPAWLSDDTPVCGLAGLETFSPRMTWRSFRNIRLPADHFAYPAINKGFEPWGGGDAAPDDWDGGEVLLRAGYPAKPGHGGNNALSWGHPHDSAPPHLKEAGGDIIGYRKRTEQPANAKSITRLTHDEAAKAGYDLSTLRALGLIREETRAERFTRETGLEPSPAVLAALAFEREA